MACKAQFEAWPAQTNVEFGIVVTDNFRTVHDVRYLAFAAQGATLFVAAVAGLFYLDVRADDIGVVRFDNLCHISHTAIADFDVVSVEYLVELVFFSEMLVNQLEEMLSNFGFYIFTEWWVEPNYISGALSFAL